MNNGVRLKRENHNVKTLVASLVGLLALLIKMNLSWSQKWRQWGPVSCGYKHCVGFLGISKVKHYNENVFWNIECVKILIYRHFTLNVFSEREVSDYSVSVWSLFVFIVVLFWWFLKSLLTPKAKVISRLCLLVVLVLGPMCFHTGLLHHYYVM